MQDGIIKKTCKPGVSYIRIQNKSNSIRNKIIRFESKIKKFESESNKNNSNPSRIRRKARLKFDLIFQSDPTNILNIFQKLKLKNYRT